MDSKPWYYSKTIWVNLVALIGAVAVSLGMQDATWLAISAPVLAVINLVLRYMTGEPITLTTPKEGQ